MINNQSFFKIEKPNIYNILYKFNIFKYKKNFLCFFKNPIKKLYKYINKILVFEKII